MSEWFDSLTIRRIPPADQCRVLLKDQWSLAEGKCPNSVQASVEGDGMTLLHCCLAHAPEVVRIALVTPKSHFPGHQQRTF
ncbi:MAG TPA: hypothetical protein VIH05_05560 [Tepidiformaceae bacterium]